MKPFVLVLTLDYELPVARGADPRRTMIQPTESILEMCGEVGASLTIMIEIGELWAFEDPANEGFSRSLGYPAAEEIRDQLTHSVSTGHDVQLHLHPHWLRARWGDGHWSLDYSKYKLTDLDREERVAALRQGKVYLERLLQPHEPSYECVVFRAGNWVTHPSR